MADFVKCFAKAIDLTTPTQDLEFNVTSEFYVLFFLFIGFIEVS